MTQYMFSMSSPHYASRSRKKDWSPVLDWTLHSGFDESIGVPDPAFGGKSGFLILRINSRLFIFFPTFWKFDIFASLSMTRFKSRVILLSKCWLEYGLWQPFCLDYSLRQSIFLIWDSNYYPQCSTQSESQYSRSLCQKTWYLYT